MTGMKLAYPFVVTVLLLALWATLALTFRPRPIVALALLIFLGMQEVMFWGASMIRSETASLMYWAIAMLFLVLAARSDRFPRRTACMFVAGLLFGLAFLTKLQAAPHVVIGALFYLWLTSFKSENPPAVGPPAARWTSAALALFGLVTFSIVAWAAWKMPLEISGAMQGEQTYFWAGNRGASFTLFRGAGFPIWLALATLSILSVALPRWRGAPPAALAWLHLSAAAAAGFVAVLFLHLLFFADLSEGWRYLLVDFKTAFLRGREQFTDTSLNRNHLDLLRMAEHYQWTVGLHFALCGMILAGWRTGLVEIPRRTALMTLALSMALLLISFFFVRFRENDMLWVQIPFNLFSLFYAGVLLQRTRTFERTLAAGVGTVFIALFAVNAIDVSTIHRRIDMNYSYFGWKDFWVMKGIFGGHQPYDRCMRGFYTNETMADEGYRQALRFQENRRLASFVLQNQRVPLMNIGSVFEGFPAWRNAMDYRIQHFSPHLREALLVDVESMPRRDFALYDKEMMRKHNSVPEKFERRPGTDTIVLSIRADAETLLFVREEDDANILEVLNDWRRPIAEATPYRITLSNGRETFTHTGIRILNYAELPVDAASKPYFLAIVKRHSRTG
jgi:hypothetical protein